MSELQSISDIFQKKLFRIPDYQRGYAWRKAQLVDFWDDIINLHPDKYHYTGLLSIKSIDKNETSTWDNEKWLLKSGYKAYHIVDGQQRLTTVAILIYEIISYVTSLMDNEGKNDTDIILSFETLKEIRNKYLSRKRPPDNIITTYLFGYEIDNPSEEYLKHKVFNEPFGGTIDETYYTKNLKYAKEFFSENINVLFQDQGYAGLELLYQKLTLQLMFNIHEIDDDYDVFVAFETMNNRGKKLTNLELLKNRLIYLTTLYNDADCDADNKTELRKNINDTWKEIYYQLGRNTKTPLSDDEFLRAHWSIYYQYTRKKGTDYIKFLLDKFSNKNIFAKKYVVYTEDVDDTQIVELDDYDEDVLDENDDEYERVDDNFLQPLEIMNYVNSLKGMAEYWYYTYFPDHSNELTAQEKLWIGRLNRVGINYFRPLVAVSMTPNVKATPEDRIELYRAIEKFIFLYFRMAMYQASYKSSYYYRKARELYFCNITIGDLTEDILDTFSLNMEEAVNGFINKTSLRFKNGNGFYSWRDLKYFLYEYEYNLSVKNNIEKINWSLFTQTEKDKVTIEHILPQTATKWYWKNQFRDYSSFEINTLSGSLGNLLPLSQSINSKLQNIGFDKKKTKTNTRRGYDNGSHSEIEVSKKQDWNAEEILKRGLYLLSFMEKRWQIVFMSNEQKIKLLHLEFVNEERSITPEIPYVAETDKSHKLNTEKKDIGQKQLDFWTEFNKYCNKINRVNDIGHRKPYAQNSYDVAVGGNGYHMFMTVSRGKVLSVGIYVYNIDTFKRLEERKSEIETYCGFKLDWYSSKRESKAKRILYSKSTDVFNPSLYIDHFTWLITTVDKVKEALVKYDNE